MLNFDKDYEISTYKLIENKFIVYNLLLKIVAFSI